MGLTWCLATVGMLLVFFEFYAAHIPEESDQREDFLEDEEEAYVAEMRESVASNPNSPIGETTPVNVNRIRMKSRGVLDYHKHRGSCASIGVRQSMRQSMRHTVMREWLSSATSDKEA